MFRKIAPQKAEDPEGGFIVQVGDRYTVQYLEGDLLAEVEVDFGTVTAVYPKTLTFKRKGGAPVQISPMQRGIIMERISSGLSCLGVEHEIGATA